MNNVSTTNSYATDPNALYRTLHEEYSRRNAERGLRSDFVERNSATEKQRDEALEERIRALRPHQEAGDQISKNADKLRAFDAELLEQEAELERKEGERLRDGEETAKATKRKRDEVEDNGMYNEQWMEASPTRRRRKISGTRVSSVMSNDQEKIPERKLEHTPESESTSDPKIAEDPATSPARSAVLSFPADARATEAVEESHAMDGVDAYGEIFGYGSSVTDLSDSEESRAGDEAGEDEDEDADGEIDPDFVAYDGDATSSHPQGQKRICKRSDAVSEDVGKEESPSPKRKKGSNTKKKSRRTVNRKYPKPEDFVEENRWVAISTNFNYANHGNSKTIWEQDPFFWDYLVNEGGWDEAYFQIPETDKPWRCNFVEGGTQCAFVHKPEDSHPARHMLKHLRDDLGYFVVCPACKQAGRRYDILRRHAEKQCPVYQPSGKEDLDEFLKRHVSNRFLRMPWTKELSELAEKQKELRRNGKMEFWLPGDEWVQPEAE